MVQVAMRLITRDDTALTAALLASTVIVFRQPLHDGLAAVQEVESRFHLDLLPALLLLVIAFGFHQYRKRAHARAEMRAALTDAAQARAQSRILQQLMTLSHGLTAARDRASLQQALGSDLQAFAPDGKLWVLTRTGDKWEALLHHQADTRSIDELERIANDALRPDRPADGGAGAREWCLPLVAGELVVGVFGVTTAVPLRDDQRSALEAAAAVLAIGIRNMQLFLEASELSLRDGLSGCFNHGHALHTLDAELRRVRRSGTPLSIVMFDIDHFKTVNDRYGHLRGDEVLAAVGARLRRVTRSSDIQCRYGGDEFVVILPETPLRGAQQVAAALQKDLATLRVAGEDSSPLTISVGITAVIAGELDATAVIERADGALYRAKAAGRNRVCVNGQARGSGECDRPTVHSISAAAS
jgi:diguanylate cyclase (GGDEF)-like protein